MIYGTSNPYASGTAGSDLFRIPSLYTLKSGRIIACCDVRYGNGTDDPANIDTAVRYSDDNGKTWSDVKFINHFDDMEDKDHDKAVPSSASFVDSATVESPDGILYHVCDACPAYMGLWSAGTYGKGNGFIDGKLALCDKTSADRPESTTLNKKTYPYYVGEFRDGFAPILKFSDGTGYDGYFVDRAYNLFRKTKSGYSEVLINQMNKDGGLNGKKIIANIFYAYAPVKIYPTYYLWLKKSTDGGKTWSDGEILNTQVNSKGFTGFAPGRGFCIEKDGKTRILFAVYDNNDGKEYASVIYSDDGNTWHRSKKASLVGKTGKSSESQFVAMNNGVLRMYSRNTSEHIGYSDSRDFGETWGEYTTDSELKYCSNCQFSVINYSKKTDGENALIISYPSKKTRKSGVVKIGLYGDDNKVSWKYTKKITSSLNPFTFVYSCLTETADGNILLLYESYKAELSLKSFSLNDLKTHDEEKLTPLSKIKSKIYNITRKNL